MKKYINIEKSKDKTVAKEYVMPKILLQILGLWNKAGEDVQAGDAVYRTKWGKLKKVKIDGHN